MDIETLPPIVKRSFGKACFYAAAPEMLRDQLWSSILENILPNFYDSVLSSTVMSKNWEKFMFMFQNNPVVAAFGSTKLWEASAKGAEGVFQPPPWHSIGWQVYFDPKLVSQWEVNRSREFVRAIVDSMLIAHGPAHTDSPDTVYDQTLRLKPAEGGGWFLVYWLDLFAKSLLLLLADMEDRDEMDSMASVTDTNFEQQCSDFNRLERLSTVDNQEGFITPVDSHAALRRFYKVCKGVFFSVSLEVLCPVASPALLAEVVQELNRRGVHVAAVCSFDWTQLTGVGLLRQTVKVGDQAVPGGNPVEIKLLHHLREIERGVAAKRLHARDNIMFNAGTIVSFRKMASGKSKQRSYAITADTIAELRQIKGRHTLSIGIYTDEASLDKVAANLLVSTANRYPDIFDLGFAWAGVTSTITNLMPSLSTAYVGVDGSRARENYWEHHAMSRLTITMPSASALVPMEEGTPRTAWAEDEGPSTAETKTMVTSDL